MYLSLMNVLIFNGLFLGGSLAGALAGRVVALVVPNVDSSVPARLSDPRCRLAARRRPALATLDGPELRLVFGV